MIHPTAVVHDDASIGEGVEIGPYCIVGRGAKIGAGCRLESHAIVRDHCDLEESVVLDSFVVVGGEAQMRGSYGQEPRGRVVIGARSVLREGVTIHRPTDAGGVTEIGPDCYFMSQSHAAHDCKVAEFVTLANGAMLAGHVAVGSHSFVGGGAGVHQFVRIGEGAMIAGNAAISYDVPPFSVAADRNDLVGLNLVGLRRRGFASSVVSDLKQCFRSVVLGCGNLRTDAERALNDCTLGKTKEGRAFLEFFVGGRRGFGQSRKRKRAQGPANVDTADSKGAQ